MSHDEDFETAGPGLASSGMLGNAALPMKEPEEMVSPEQKSLALELRMMATQVECERLAEAAKKAHKEALKAKNAMRQRIVYQSGQRKQAHRISLSVRLDDAHELIAWMDIARRTTLKAPPKGAIKFFQALSKRLAREP